nr:uncharacterized protein LOC118879312 [Drosophila suzukii]
MLRKDPVPCLHITAKPLILRQPTVFRAIGTFRRNHAQLAASLAIVLAAEGEVPAVHSDLAVSVAGSRVGVQPRLVTKIRRPSVLDAPRPCVAITPSCRMILRFLAQAAVDPWRVVHLRSRSLPGFQFRRPSVASSCLLPLLNFRWTICAAFRAPPGADGVGTIDTWRIAPSWSGCGLLSAVLRTSFFNFIMSMNPFLIFSRKAWLTPNSCDARYVWAACARAAFIADSAAVSVFRVQLL